MTKLLLAAIAIGLGACSAPAGESTPEELPGGGTAPGNSPNGEDQPHGAATPAPEAAGTPLSQREAFEDPRGETPVAFQPARPIDSEGTFLPDGTALTEEQVKSGLVPKSFTIISRSLEGGSSGRSNLILTDTSPTSHICALSMIWGTLYGSGSQVLVTTNSTNWFMTTYPIGNPERIALSTICYPLAAFSARAAGYQVFTPSGEFLAKLTTTGSRGVDMWKSDAAAIITGVGGRFSGGGELARTVLSTNTQTLASAQIFTGQGGQHMTWARSFFVGIPGGDFVPRFIGPRGTGSLSAAGQWTVTYDADNEFNSAYVTMAPIGEAFCYLTSVTGDWGPDDFVQVARVGSNWVLNSFAGDDDRITASAACYKLEQ